MDISFPLYKGTYSENHVKVSITLTVGRLLGCLIVIGRNLEPEKMNTIFIS